MLGVSCFCLLPFTFAGTHHSSVDESVVEENMTTQKNDHRKQHRTSNRMDNVLIVLDDVADDEHQRNPQGLKSLFVNGRHSQFFVITNFAEGKFVEPTFSGQCKFALCV